MIMLSVFRKSLREQTREIWILALTVLAAPFFVFLYWLLFPAGSTTYLVLTLNEDRPVSIPGGASVAGGQMMIEALAKITYADGKPILRLQPVATRAEGESRLKNRDAAAMVVLPADFSAQVVAAAQGRGSASAALVGDLTNPQYAVTAAMIKGAVDQFAQAAGGWQRPIQFADEALGGSAARTEFENYVPGLLILAVVMLIFQASMAVAREVETGTLRRMQLTRMTAADLLVGISTAQVLVGVVAVVLTFGVATLLGFHSQGPIWVALAVGGVTSLSVVGVGLLVACFSRTVTEAFVIGNVPLMLLMFFTGAIFPMPEVPLFSVAGQTFALYDLLPPTHGVVALHKVLTLGAGLGDVTYELAALLILSAAYFGAGIWLFQHMRLRAA